jgi:hypothetical protein
VLTDGDSELKLVIMTAVLGSADETSLRLATIARPPDIANSSPTRR